MKFQFSIVKRLVIPALFICVLLWGCKKQETDPDPDPPKEEEKIIPGVTVGYGAILLDQAEYEKIPLIQEPQIANARTNKDPKLAEQYDLAPTMPPVQSQGAQGSCTSWAVAYAARGYFNKLFNNVNYLLPDGSVNHEAVLSPAFVYNQTKVGDCSTGSNVPRALELLKTSGVCTWKDMPYTDKECATQPTEEQKQKAAKFKIKDWGRIERDVNTFRKFLYYDFPIVISAILNEDFKNYGKDTDGSYIWKDGSIKSPSYHAMVIVGYDNKRKAFKIQNSWSTSWANKGYIWMSYEILQNVIREAYVMVPGDAPESMAKPIVVTEEAGTISNGQIELKGHFSSLGAMAVIRYGIAVSTTSTEPTDRLEVVGKPISGDNHAFAVLAPAVGPKLHYRAFAETPFGVVYGNTLTKDIKTENNGALDKGLLFASPQYILDGATGAVVSEYARSDSFNDYEGFTLSKTHYFYVNRDDELIATGIVDNIVKWVFPIGSRVHGYPVVDEKTVYFSSTEAVIALDITTGAKKWEFKGAGYSGQPVVSGNRVYVGQENKGIAAVDAATGKLVKEYPGTTGRNIATVKDGVLYFITNAGISAYDITTGSQVWDYKDTEYFINSKDKSARPIFSNGKLYYSCFSSGTGTKSKLLAVDAKTGKVAWEKPLEVSIPPQGYMSVDEGILIYLTEAKGGQVLLKGLDAATGGQLWEKVYTLSYGGNSLSLYDALIVGQTVFVCGGTANLQALNARTGDIIWTAGYLDTGGTIRPSFVSKEGKVYQLPDTGI